MKIYPQTLRFSLKPQIWSFHVDDLPATAKKWTRVKKKKKPHVQSVQSYWFCSLNMQICNVLVAVAVVGRDLKIYDGDGRRKRRHLKT